MENPLIECTSLTFGYTPRKPLFKDLSLHVQPGAVYGLFGKNGAGKTSLLKCIAGLRFPSRGDCRVFGISARSRSPLLYQDLFFLPETTAVPDQRIDSFGRDYGRFYPRFDRASFDSYLRRFELRSDHRLHSLSHGQRKKALLAFALAANTTALLLDEPTNGLDIPSKGQFRQALAEQDSAGRAILISTHQVREIDSVISGIIILEQGAIIFNRPRETIERNLVTGITQDHSAAERALYAEKTPGGWATLDRNSTQTPAAVDLEILFNAAVAEPRKIRECVHREPNA